MSIGLKLSIVATVILALSTVGVLAAERFDSPNQKDAVAARETAPDREKPDQIKLAAKPLELGTDAKVSSDYRVAVSEISRYDVPKGQLIVATIDATYIGKHDGEPWSDLDVEFVSSGSRAFGESDCPPGLGDVDPSDRPTLATGGNAKYPVCMDLPVKDIKGGQVMVEEAFSDGDRGFWSTTGAVTKTLPSIAPKPRATQGPATRYQPKRQSDDDRRSNACDDFDEGKFEDYKKWGDDLKDQFRDYKDAGGDDQDKIDDFEKWEKKYDKIIDYYQKLDEACN
jgi:hypothetical protein